MQISGADPESGQGGGQNVFVHFCQLHTVELHEQSEP